MSHCYQDSLLIVNPLNGFSSIKNVRKVLLKTKICFLYNSSVITLPKANPTSILNPVVDKNI